MEKNCTELLIFNFFEGKFVAFSDDTSTVVCVSARIRGAHLPERESKISV